MAITSCQIDMDSLQTKLHGKRAFITAGAQGIGLAISRRLAVAGCDVFVHYHSSADAAKELCNEFQTQGLRAACAGGDLTRAEDCERLVEMAAAFLGGIDVLINNAGSLVARKQLEEGSEEFWTEVMSLNLGRGFNFMIPKGVLKGLRFSADVMVPVWQDLNGYQLGTDYLVTGGIQYAW